MLKQVLGTFFRLVFVLYCFEAANILCIYPVPYHSHQIAQRVLTEELARQGHQLVVLTTLPHKEPVQNITEIDVHEGSYMMWDKNFEKEAKNRETYAILNAKTFQKMILSIMDPIVDFQVRHPHWQALMKNDSVKFDLILFEGKNATYVSTLRTKFQAHVVKVSALSTDAETFRLMGAETNDFFYPDHFTIFAGNFSFWDKLQSLYNHIESKWSQWKIATFTNEVMTKILGRQASASEKMNRRIEMLFLNVHRFWDNNRPSPIGSVLHMGGLELERSESLPEELRQFADTSKHGVIIMSFGSKLKISTLPENTLRVIINVFARLPYDVVLKWEADVDVIPNKPSNVRLEKRLPQMSLLQHSNVKAFVTHGGLYATDEAIYAGVPMIGLPVFVDQWTNAHQYEKHDIGVQLNIDDLEEDEFMNAIKEVIENPKYRENIRRLSRVMTEQRQRSGSRAAAYWVQHLLSHGGRHLRSPLADTTVVEFYMIDLIGTIVLFVLVICSAVVFFVKHTIRLFKVHVCKYFEWH